MAACNDDDTFTMEDLEPAQIVAILSTALDYACQRLAQAHSTPGGWACNAQAMRDALIGDARAATLEACDIMEHVTRSLAPGAEQ